MLYEIAQLWLVAFIAFTVGMIIEYNFGIVFKIIFTIRMYRFIRSYDDESQVVEDRLDFGPFSEEDEIKNQEWYQEYNEKQVNDWDGGN